MNKILIIDDDRELCALIKRSVQAENIEADFCNTGKEGLQKLKEQEYQLVVLDVMMMFYVNLRQSLGKIVLVALFFVVVLYFRHILGLVLQFYFSVLVVDEGT